LKGFEELEFFVPDAGCVGPDGGLHSYVSEHLQKVILYHVAHRTALIVVAATATNTDGFGRRDLYGLYVVPVPEWLEKAVGEAGYQQVLYCFLAQVVVDPVDRILPEMGLDVLVEFYGRLFVVAEGLLYDQPCPTLFVFVQAGFGQRGGDGAVQFGRGRKIEDVILAYAQIFV